VANEAPLPLQALVVEMDPFFAILVREAFSARGIACRMAYSARAAALLVRSERFQIVILGARLPDDRGLNLVEKIREAQGPAIPVVMVGTDDTPEFQSEVMETGADKYLVKPLSIQDLLEAVAKWLPPA
jgi:DNA-binding response OmpR family regulator